MKPTIKMLVYGILTIVGICLTYYSWNVSCEALTMNIQGQTLNVGIPTGLEKLLCISTNVNSMIMITAGFVLFASGLGGVLKQVDKL